MREAVNDTETAFHEAGHAVIGCVLNRCPRSVDIIPDSSGNAGHTDFHNHDTPAYMQRHLDESEEKKEHIRKLVLIKLAGTAAHTMKYPDRVEDIGDQHDFLEAKYLVENHGRWIYDYPEYLNRMKLEVMTLLQLHWPQVEEVASLLLTEKSIGTEDLIKVCFPNQR